MCANLRRLTIQTLFRQAPWTSPSPRNPFPSTLVHRSVSADSCSVEPHAPLPRGEVRHRHPLRLRLRVCRRESRFRLPLCDFPSTQSIGPVPHRFHSAPGKSWTAGSGVHYRHRFYWRVHYIDQNSKICLFHFSFAVGLEGAGSSFCVNVVGSVCAWYLG